MVEAKRSSAPPKLRSDGQVVTTKSSTRHRPNVGPVGRRASQAKCDNPARGQGTKAASGGDLDPATGIIVAIALSLALWGGSLVLFWFVTWLL